MKVIARLFSAATLVLFYGRADAQFIQLDGVDDDYISSYLSRAADPASGYDALVAAMMARHHAHDSLPGFLSQSYSDRAREVLRLSLIVEYCSENATHVFCSGKPVDELLAADDDNFVPYLMAASVLLREGDDAQALAMIEAGLKAPVVNNYYLDKLALTRRELTVRGYRADRVNLASEGYAGAVYLYGFYDYLLNTCRTKPQQSAAWKEACFAMGAKLEEQGKGWGDTVFGASIQRDVLQNTDPQSSALPAILTRREYYNTIRIDAAAAHPWWDDATRASVPDSFYDDSVELGELRAIERVLNKDGSQTRAVP